MHTNTRVGRGYGYIYILYIYSFLVLTYSRRHHHHRSGGRLFYSFSGTMGIAASKRGVCAAATTAFKAGNAVVFSLRPSSSGSAASSYYSSSYSSSSYSSSNPETTSGGRMPGGPHVSSLSIKIMSAARACLCVCVHPAGSRSGS